MLRRRLAKALATVALSFAGVGVLEGCVCCSIGEYAPQCLNACGQLCFDACVPICIDTIRGEGPFNAAAGLAKEARAGETPPPGLDLPTLQGQPTAVSY